MLVVETIAKIRRAFFGQGKSIKAGMSFSARMNIAIRATQTMFITPPTNSSSISIQQHPTQYEPCHNPMRNGPRFQCWVMNSSGERQRRKQARFNGVN